MNRLNSISSDAQVLFNWLVWVSRKGKKYFSPFIGSGKLFSFFLQLFFNIFSGQYILMKIIALPADCRRSKTISASMHAPAVYICRPKCIFSCATLWFINYWHDSFPFMSSGLSVVLPIFNISQFPAK